MPPPPIMACRRVLMVSMGYSAVQGKDVASAASGCQGWCSRAAVGRPWLLVNHTLVDHCLVTHTCSTRVVLQAGVHYTSSAAEKSHLLRRRSQTQHPLQGCPLPPSTLAR